MHELIEPTMPQMLATFLSVAALDTPAAGIGLPALTRLTPLRCVGLIGTNNAVRLLRSAAALPALRVLHLPKFALPSDTAEDAMGPEWHDAGARQLRDTLIATMTRSVTKRRSPAWPGSAWPRSPRTAPTRPACLRSWKPSPASRSCVTSWVQFSSTRAARGPCAGGYPPPPTRTASRSRSAVTRSSGRSRLSAAVDAVSAALPCCAELDVRGSDGPHGAALAACLLSAIALTRLGLSLVYDERAHELGDAPFVPWAAVLRSIGALPTLRSLTIGVVAELEHSNMASLGAAFCDQFAAFTALTHFGLGCPLEQHSVVARALTAATALRMLRKLDVTLYDERTSCGSLPQSPTRRRRRSGRTRRGSARGM
eukprot:jgi/Ulvmu1/10696/UM067_0022.1